MTQTCHGVIWVSKYTDEQLKEMALEVVVDLNANGLLSLQLLITMSALTNLEPEIVMERIKEYARG